MSIMKSGFKKFQTALLAFVCTAGTFPAYAAHTESTFEEVNRQYFYINKFDSKKENGNLGFETVLVEDPKDSSNKVMHVTDSNGTGEGQSDYNVLALSGLSDGWAATPTYQSMGFDNNKLIIMETDIYLPAGLTDEINTLKIGAPAYDSIWNIDLCGAISVSKKDESGFIFKTGSAQKDIAADEWYNVKFTYNVRTGAWKSYIDGETFSSGTLSDWLRPNFTAVAQGLKVESKGGALTDGFYLDNVSMYQLIPQDIIFGISDGETDVAAEDGISVNIGTAVSAEALAGKFKATDAEGVSTVGTVTSIDDTNVLVSFTGLSENTEYTLEFSGYSTAAAILNSASVTFTTKAAVDMTVLADIEDNAQLDPGDNAITLTFSQKVVLDDVVSKITLLDEDAGSVVFNGETISDNQIKINMPSLSELTGFIFTLDDTLTSEAGLPLRAGIIINFRTKQNQVKPPEDTYEPDVNSDSIILKNSDMGKKWYINDLDSAASFADDITVLNTGEKAASFYPDSADMYAMREEKSGIYSENTVIAFNFDMKIPDKTVTKTVQIRMTFNCTDANNDTALKDYGSWTPGCYIRYNSSGISFYKDSVAGKAVRLYSFDEVPENEWLNIRGYVNMKSGLVTIYREDGTYETLDMNLSPGWGADDKYSKWGIYMYLHQFYFYVGTGAEVQFANVDVKRLSNTLSVTDASFAHGEYYVDTDNITLEFNDEVEAENLENAVYITDADGNKVECTVDARSAGNVCNLSIDGLKSYTEYTLNIENLLAKSLRKMPDNFERTFVTKKRSEVFVDVMDSRAVLNTFNKRLAKAEKIEYTAVLKNEGAGIPEVMGAVVVYGENDSIMKIQYKDMTVGENLFVLNGIPEGAVCVRVFAWNKKDGEIAGLLHEPDTLQDVTSPEYEINYEKTLPEFTTVIVDSSKSLIGVSGKTAETEGVYTILMLEGMDAPLSDASTKTVALSYSEIDSEQFASVFATDAASGDYTMYVITDGAVYKKNFKYLKLSDLVELYIKKISDGTITQSQIYEKTVEYNAGIGIDFTAEFVSDRDKKLFEKRMYERRTLLTGPTDSEYAEQLLGNIDFAGREIKYLNELSEITYYGLVKAKLDEGTEFTNIDYTAYNKLSDTQKAAVMAKMVKQTFTDGDAVKNYFDNLVANPPADNSNKKPSYSGAGGGGGGGGGSVSSTIYPENSVVTNNAVKDEVTSEDVFTDMAGYEWADEAVLYLERKGIVSGVSETEFNPEGVVTREQFAKMVVLAAGVYKSSAVCDFSDVEADAWYASYIASAKNAGIIAGIDEENFGVGQPIKREDMAVMIYRAFGIKNVVFTERKVDFDDMKDISEYAFEAVSALAGKGIINGMADNTFAPLKNASRAESAMLIKALAEGVN